VVTYTIAADFQGTSLLNIAEITTDDGDDEDSDPNNDDEGEDDQDDEEVPVEQMFDLALEKVLSTTTPGPFNAGNPVTFTITVYNQGTLTATDIQISDYIPTGLLLADGDWNEASSEATLMDRIASLDPGEEVSVDISFTIDANFMGTTIRNWAEISDADNALGLDDKDSTPDATNFNQGGETDDLDDDNVTDEDGLNGNGDEDDHDPAEITVNQVFDLALIKRLNSSVTPGPFVTGDLVIFEIEVFNQGTIDAQNVVISDYVPAGLELIDGNWTCLLYTSPSPRD